MGRHAGKVVDHIQSLLVCFGECFQLICNIAAYERRRYRLLTKPGAVNGRRTGGKDDGGENEVGLITVPSAFALRRIRQPYLPAIL